MAFCNECGLGLFPDPEGPIAGLVCANGHRFRPALAPTPEDLDLGPLPLASERQPPTDFDRFSEMLARAHVEGGRTDAVVVVKNLELPGRGRDEPNAIGVDVDFMFEDGRLTGVKARRT